MILDAPLKRSDRKPRIELIMPDASRNAFSNSLPRSPAIRNTAYSRVIQRSLSRLSTPAGVGFAGDQIDGSGARPNAGACRRPSAPDSRLSRSRASLERPVGGRSRGPPWRANDRCGDASSPNCGFLRRTVLRTVVRPLVRFPQVSLASMMGPPIRQWHGTTSGLRSASAT